MIPPGWLRSHRARVAVLLALWILVSGHPASAGRKKSASSENDKKPKVVLSASPAFGFPPLSVQLVGTLSGVDARDPNFCHAGVTWVRVDPGSRPETGTKLSEVPRCLHPEKEVSVPTTFSKTFDLYEPGSYLYRLIIQGKDGAQLRSNYVTVKVMRMQ
jgi:hypothetical protein